MDEAYRDQLRAAKDHVEQLLSETEESRYATAKRTLLARCLEDLDGVESLARAEEIDQGVGA